ncbi:MAG: Gfo/Idh/MocA family oxidoreductase [Candidatus Nealsonbacteria bacterium]|nr:Gfo/Idh/MocA family oxidoreductase [Candidatus Nealsonbacteria bacterium]
MKYPTNTRPTRRNFLRGTLAAFTAPYLIPSSALGADGTTAASERIGMGAIGLGGQGTRNMEAFLSKAEVQMVALCDVDKGSTRYEDAWHRGLAPAMEKVEQHYAGKTAAGRFRGLKGYQDFRELLARDDIDAVCIGTPDHWHAPIAVAAAKAGKDMYCEKPLSLTVCDGRAMADAVARYDRVFQCGSQRRSDARCRRSCELVRNGRIGKLQTVRVGLPGGHWIRKNAKKSFDPEPVPESLDYDMWLGPAPWGPYAYNRCHWNFRWNLDYSGGNVTDWGAHLIDMAHWGMDCDESGPIEVEGKGTFPPRTAMWNAATEFEFTCTYASGVKLIVRSGGPVRFEGTEGWVDLGGKTEPESLATSEIGRDEIHLYESHSQHVNFLECIRTRRRTAAPVEVAHRTITVAHLGNIAMLTGRKLRWDPATEQIIGDEGAARMLGRAKRGPWRV